LEDNRLFNELLLVISPAAADQVFGPCSRNYVIISQFSKFTTLEKNPTASRPQIQFPQPSIRKNLLFFNMRLPAYIIIADYNLTRAASI
jgi:hypothetical protein